MMPAQFKPRNYAFEVPDRDTDTTTKGDGDDTDTDDEGCTKTVSNDIFDTLLSLVTPNERIQHDVKTRRKRQSLPHENKKEKKRQNKTRRTKAGLMK